jgi:hypothetical protein
MKWRANPDFVPYRYEYLADTTVPREHPMPVGSIGALRYMSVSIMSTNSSATSTCSSHALTENGLL